MPVERACDLALPVGKEVRVAERDVCALVAEAVGDGHGGIAHVDKEGHVAVSQVVDADALHARRLAAARHLVVHAVLGEREHALVVPHGMPLEPVGQLVGEEAGHGHGPHGFRRLGVGDDVAALEALVGFADGHDGSPEVDVVGREGEHLSDPEAAPVEDLERAEAVGLVGDRVREPEVLVLRPEEHVARLVRPHLRRAGARALAKPVEAHGVVEDGGKLVVDGAQVRGRVGLSVGVAHSHQLVLPSYYVDRVDLVHAHPAEGRQYLVADHVLLADPRALAQARLHVPPVHLEEGGEGGADRPLGFAPALILPLEGRLLGGKSALRPVAPLPVVVAEPELRGPRPVVLLTHRHAVLLPQSTILCCFILGIYQHAIVLSMIAYGTVLL